MATLTDEVAQSEGRNVAWSAESVVLPSDGQSVHLLGDSQPDHTQEGPDLAKQVAANNSLLNWLKGK